MNSKFALRIPVLNYPICIPKQDPDMMDALAQLSMAHGPPSVHSRSIYSLSSELYIASPEPVDTADTLSFQTFGTALSV